MRIVSAPLSFRQLMELYLELSYPTSVPTMFASSYTFNRILVLVDELEKSHGRKTPFRDYIQVIKFMDSYIVRDPGNKTEQIVFENLQFPERSVRWLVI